MTPDEAKAKASDILDEVSLGEPFAARWAIIALTEAISTALLEAAGEWNHDMDAAPKDKQILAYSRDHVGPLILSWFKYSGVEAWRDWDNDAQRPTCWRLLPESPEEGQ